MRTLTAGSVAGGATVGLAYAAARRTGLTRVDLAARLAPGRPLLGRLAQLAVGSAGCLPCAASRRPARATALGAAIGLANGLRQAHSGELAVSVAAHAAGGAVAALVTRRRADPASRPRSARRPRSRPRAGGSR